MANIRLEDINGDIRKAVELIAAIGGFGDEYYAVSNGKFKSEMFLYNLNGLIEGKRYKSIIGMLKNEYPSMNFEKENNMISDDEKLLRRSLRGVDSGYGDDDFFIPKYDKGELVRWDGSKYSDIMFRIKTSYKDSGMNYYSLTNTNSGVEHGVRLREDELREPTTLENIIYYKKQGMLDVHLFNKLAPIDEVTKEYALTLLEAIKGIDTEDSSQEVREIAYATQKGYIDMNTHHTFLAMVSGSAEFENNPIPLKLPSENITSEGILSLEKYAIKSIEILDQYRTIYADIKDLKKEMASALKLNPDNAKLETIKEELPGFNLNYDKLTADDMAKVYGSAHWTIKGSNPEIYKKISDITDKTIEFVMQRDMYNLNRPDLNPLIEKAQMTRDLKRKDIVIFRGDRNESFEHYNIKSSMQELLGDNVAELNLANNGYRRELYQTPSDSHSGSDFSYCEGDLSLVVPKNKDDFMVNLDSDIKFYLEDEYSEVSDDKFNEIKSEMISKLGCETLSPSIDECIQQIEEEEAAKASANVGMK